MKQYHDLLTKVLSEGILQPNRTGTSAYSIVGEMLSFDMADGFPAVTTKKLAFKQVKGELVGFIRGCTNVKDFQALGCTVWDLNAESVYWKANPANQGDGDLGCIYGSQWRNWFAYDYEPNYSECSFEYQARGIDQLANAINDVINNPTSRRIIVTAWNPAEIGNMALPPCHTGFQLYVNTRDGELSMTMNQRSCDMFLGIPFNIASYALLLHILAEATGLKARHLKMFLTDVHVYDNHVSQVQEQLSRSEYQLPTLSLRKKRTDEAPLAYVESLMPDDMELVGYQSHGAIKAAMAV